MKRFVNTIGIVIIFINFGFVHDYDKAFFRITHKENIIEVKAEFPWTIRKALLKEYPELRNSKDQQEFDKAFFDYVQNNFTISSADCALTLISVVEGEEYGHSHQNSFKFTFKGNSFDAIHNTIMFNLSESHKNYHQLQWAGKTHLSITTLDYPNIILEE